MGESGIVVPEWGWRRHNSKPSGSTWVDVKLKRDVWSIPNFCGCSLWPWIGPPPVGWRNPNGRDNFGGFLRHRQCIVQHNIWDPYYRLNVQVTAYARQTVPDRGVVGSRDPLQTFWGFNHVNGTAEPKVVKFCTRVGYINSRNRMTYTHKRGRGHGHVTVLKFCLCRDAARRAASSATAGLLVCVSN